MIACRLVAVHHPDAAVLLGEYFRELVDRYNGRLMPQSEVDDAVRDHPSDDVAAFLRGDLPAHVANTAVLERVRA